MSTSITSDKPNGRRRFLALVGAADVTAIPGCTTGADGPDGDNATDDTEEENGAGSTDGTDDPEDGSDVDDKEIDVYDYTGMDDPSSAGWRFLLPAHEAGGLRGVTVQFQDLTDHACMDVHHGDRTGAERIADAQRGVVSAGIDVARRANRAPPGSGRR